MTGTVVDTAPAGATGGLVQELKQRVGVQEITHAESEPAQEQPAVSVGQRFTFNRQPNPAKPHRHTGMWQVIASDGLAIQFQQVSQDGSRLIARKTTKLTIDQVRDERDAGRIVPVA